MTTWEYRVEKAKDVWGEEHEAPYYQIVEAFTEDPMESELDGITSICETSPIAETVEDLRKVLTLMLEALDKPVIIYNEKNLSWDEES